MQESESDAAAASRTNEARSRETRAALIAAARTVFAAKGYASAGTPEIVRAAGVTRGALYHHFADKEALFRAVLEAETRAVGAAIDAGAGAAGTAFEALHAGARAFHRAMAEPGRVRLLLIDGPAALGPEVLRKLDEAGAAGTLRDGLQEAADTGEMVEAPIDALAALLSAAFDRAAIDVAEGAESGKYAAALDILIAGLRRAGDRS